jgi:predicted DNA-binding protein
MKSSQRTIMTSVRVPADLRAWLKAEAKRTGRNVSQVIVDTLADQRLQQEAYEEDRGKRPRKSNVRGT